jgi:hypothetical protein
VDTDLGRTDALVATLGTTSFVFLEAGPFVLCYRVKDGFYEAVKESGKSARQVTVYQTPPTTWHGAPNTTLAGTNSPKIMAFVGYALDRSKGGDQAKIVKNGATEEDCAKPALSMDAGRTCDDPAGNPPCGEGPVVAAKLIDADLGDATGQASDVAGKREASAAMTFTQNGTYQVCYKVKDALQSQVTATGWTLLAQPVTVYDSTVVLYINMRLKVILSTFHNAESAFMASLGALIGVDPKRIEVSKRKSETETSITPAATPTPTTRRSTGANSTTPTPTPSPSVGAYSRLLTRCTVKVYPCCRGSSGTGGVSGFRDCGCKPAGWPSMQVAYDATQNLTGKSINGWVVLNGTTSGWKDMDIDASNAATVKALPALLTGNNAYISLGMLVMCFTGGWTLLHRTHLEQHRKTSIFLYLAIAANSAFCILGFIQSGKNTVDYPTGERTMLAAQSFFVPMNVIFGLFIAFSQRRVGERVFILAFCGIFIGLCIIMPVSLKVRSSDKAGDIYQLWLLSTLQA